MINSAQRVVRPKLPTDWVFEVGLLVLDTNFIEDTRCAFTQTLTSVSRRAFVFAASATSPSAEMSVTGALAETT